MKTEEEKRLEEQIRKLKEKQTKIREKREQENLKKELEKWKELGEILLQIRSHKYTVDFHQVEEIICRILGEKAPAKTEQKTDENQEEN